LSGTTANFLPIQFSKFSFQTAEFTNPTCIGVLTGRNAARLKPSSGRVLQTERRIQVLSAQFFLGTTPKLFAPAAWLTSFAPQAMRTLSYFLISQHLGSFNEVSLLPSNQ
jgi:hypothetical protein